MLASLVLLYQFFQSCFRLSMMASSLFLHWACHCCFFMLLPTIKEFVHPWKECQYRQVTQRMIHLKWYVTHTPICVTHFHEDETMTRSRLPLVSDDHLLRLDGAEDQFDSIVVGSDSWYTWLAAQDIRSFSFKSSMGSFTARCERKRHGWYWYAYRKHTGRLHKAYLGKSEELTPERLQAVAAALSAAGNSKNGSVPYLHRPNKRHPAISADTISRHFQAPTFTYTGVTESRQAARHNLPAQLTRLIGREQEVATACVLLREPEVRLLTLSGTGGVGKTCLSLRIASDLAKDFADGVCFVSLASINDSDLVLPTIAQTLGLRELVDQSRIELLTAYFHEKDLLLLLDNFEHVIGAAPALAALLGSCPSLKILVTSREVLRLRGERAFPVLPLALPDLSHLPEPGALSEYAAIALFLQRAHSVNPDFQITSANAKTIAAICTHLDGLPLGLELAAARLKVLSPQALLARLEHRFAILTQGPRDMPARQQTLRNTLAWSYDLLNVQEQRLFRQLALFAGGCTMEAIEAICKTPDDENVHVFDLATSLLDKSLIQQQRAAGEEELRFMMLETIREYGLEYLAISGELELTRRAHAQYFLGLAQEIGSQLSDPQQAVRLERLEREHDNLRAAMGWSLERGDHVQDVDERIATALQFGIALRGFWVVHGHWSEGRTFLKQALAASEGKATPLQAKALEVAVSLAVYQLDHERGEALCHALLAQCRERGDIEGIAFALYLLGTCVWQRGDFAVARSFMEQSLAVSKQVDDKKMVAHVLSDLAGMLTQQGEYEQAYALLEESLSIDRELGNIRGIAYSLRALALTIFVSKGDPARVCALLEESLALSQELGDKSALARCLSHMALVALRQDDAVRARELAEESMALHKEIGEEWGISWVLAIVAKVKACQGNDRASIALYEESLALARKINSKLNIAVCLEGMASVLAKQGEFVRATLLWGAAEALREAIAAPIWPVERDAYERSVTEARSRLGEWIFAATWSQGRTRPLEQILTAQEPATISTLIPVGRSSTSPATSTAGLSRREVEVLRLLTTGLTNTQIAAQLVISLTTVNTHVGSIYTKLGVNSRAAATRYAVEHHLV
jgi:predicted ATPase/DNA-binding CsgD family transcriptional regulator